ncbi:MAG TPA: FMN-binding protein [Candidatus Hydrogenedentes bacterium]|nr:FMN-binding protein [Candidatus Hydrogenedentota bacterium]HOL76910.1 FMN-binding protein [Candidatus Hydrogenedentota bacterium]HPO85562.1 FMN-binding protein [Candidatus Hydrogenedentota bacterium]
MTIAELQAMPVVKPQRTSAVRMVTVLGLISTICGLVIVLAYSLTISAIRANLAQIARDAVLEVLPQAKQMKIFEVRDTGEISKVSGMEGDLPKIFAGYDEKGNLVGVAFQARGRGYADLITVMCGYVPDKQCISGFKVLESKETPGLGDKIATDPGFLANFKELDVSLGPDQQSLAHPVEAVKNGSKTEKWQIDGISGATISSKAVARMLTETASHIIPIIVKNLEVLRKG